MSFVDSLIGIIIFLLGMMCMGGIFEIVGNTYQSGQIAAMNGTMEYALIVQTDGSTNWEYIEEPHNIVCRIVE